MGFGGSINVSSITNDGGFFNWPRENTLDEYEYKLDIIINSFYSDDQLIEQAEKQLEWVNDQRKLEAQKQAKRKLSKRRRSAFAQKRDELMLALIERDGYECAECGEVEGLTIDHIMPLSKGGSDELDNLQLLCKKHNSSKGDSVP